MPAQHQVHGRLAKTKVAKRHFLEERRQPRLAQQDFVAVRIEFESEGRLQERKRRARGPGLRRAGDRIKRRPALASALEAAIEFGQPPQVHVGRGIEQALEHTIDRALVAVARKARRDQRVVVRPD